MASLEQLSGTLGRTRAAHLLRRTTYRPTTANIEYYRARTAGQAIDELFNIKPLTIIGPVDYQNPNKSLIETKNFNPDPGDWIVRHYVKAWWLDEAIKDESIGHKLEFLLHSNFVVSNEDMDAYDYHDYLKLNRFYAKGNIKTLAKKMSINIVMMHYLDGNENHRDSPNENYAREFLELFSIGKGPSLGEGNYTFYTEEDVQAAARVFTGWRTWDEERQGFDTAVGVATAYPVSWAHDKEDKQFSEAFGNTIITGRENEEDYFQEIDDFVEMVFNQIATARNIIRKVYRFFVHSKITSEIESDIISPLADQLYNDNYNLEGAIKTLLKSKHFYDEDDGNAGDEIIGSMMKSPIDLLSHTINFFEIGLPDRYSEYLEHHRWFYKHTVLDNLFEKANLKLFEPPSVAGYPDLYQEPFYYRLRMTSNTIVARYKLPEVIIKKKNVLAWGKNLAISFDIIQFIKTAQVITNPSSASALVRDLTDTLFPQPASSGRYHYFLNDVFLQDLPEMDWEIDYNTYLATGDRNLIITPLERLFTALISSQEFQLM